jgi:hypothetical protein
MEKKQTAVEWFMEQIGEKQPNGFYVIDTLEDVKNVFAKAKQMEKEQMLGFEDLVDKHQMDALENNAIYLSAEEVYNETYGGKDE